MAQTKTTKTGKGKATETAGLDKDQTSILMRLVGLLEGMRNQRVAIGQRFYELIVSGMSITAAIAAVKARLPEAPEFYLGAKLTPATAKALIAIGDAARNGGLVHGNNHVTEDDINLLKLNVEQQAALMTAMKRGTEKGRPGVSIAAVKALANTVRKDGLESEKAQKALGKIMTRVSEVGGYHEVMPADSIDALKIAEAEALRAVKRSEDSLAKAQDRLNAVRNQLRTVRAASKQAEAQAVEPTAVKPARARQAKAPKAQPIAAAAH